MAALATTTSTELEHAGSLPTGQLVAAWLETLRSPNTRAAYSSDLDRWLAHLAEHDTDPVAGDPRALRALANRWRLNMEAEGLAPATQARRLAAVSSWYRWTHSEGFTGTNPTQDVTRPVVDDDSPTLGLDRAELGRLLEQARAMGPTDYALMLLLSVVGLRASEACSLQATDLGTEHGHRVVKVTGKGGRRVTLKLSTPVAEACTEALAGRRTGPVLTDNEGRALSRHKVTYRVRKAARLAELTDDTGRPKRITAHSLRHTCATLARLSGADLSAVQDQLRHRDPRTTRRYDRQAGRLENAASDSLSVYLGL